MKKIITASLVGTLLVTGTSTVVNAQKLSQMTLKMTKDIKHYHHKQKTVLKH